MTDRELLEKAARAAGYTSFGYGEMCGGEPCLLLKESDFTGMWAPLTDDGDALRLAVALRMQIDCDDLPGYEDREAAVRRAIVRAAAAMADQQ